MIPLEPDHFTITKKRVAKLVDENTICVGVILGTTFTGEIDPIEEINDLLVETKNTRGWDIPIHVDAAIGGFILPFSKPGLMWNFRLGQVKSINVSAHKYGLVYPGLGWLIFRDTSDLPDELMFYVNYLGDEMASYTLNFSRGSRMLLAQYYNMLRLGWLVALALIFAGLAAVGRGTAGMMIVGIIAIILGLVAIFMPLLVGVGTLVLLVAVGLIIFGLELIISGLMGRWV